MNQLPCPLLDEHVLEAMRSFASRPGNVDRLIWWLRSPHSAERWLQFELAFEFHILLRDKFHILCEQQWADIAIVPRDTLSKRLWEIPAVFRLELKWIGNWYVNDKTLNGILRDAEKIKKRGPGLALVACAVVDPGPRCAVHYEWISTNPHHVGTDRFEQRLTKLFEAGFRAIGPAVSLSTPEFKTLELRAYGFRNGGDM